MIIQLDTERKIVIVEDEQVTLGELTSHMQSAQPDTWTEYKVGFFSPEEEEPEDDGMRYNQLGFPMWYYRGPSDARPNLWPFSTTPVITSVNVENPTGTSAAHAHQARTREIAKWLDEQFLAKNPNYDPLLNELIRTGQDGITCGDFLDMPPRIPKCGKNEDMPIRNIGPRQEAAIKIGNMILPIIEELMKQLRADLDKVQEAISKRDQQATKEDNNKTVDK